MFNTDERLVKLAEGYISLFTPEETEIFQTHFMNLVALQGFSSFLHGLTVIKFHGIFTSTLQHLAGTITPRDEKRASQIWNPFVSKLWRSNCEAIEALQNTGPKPTVVRRQEITPTPGHPKAVGGVARTVIMPRPISPVRACVDQPREVLPKQGSSATSLRRSVIPPPKGEVDKGHTRPIRAPNDMQIKAYLEMVFKESGTHLYSTHPWVTKICSSKQCIFCRTMFKSLVVTKCGSDTGFPCTEGKPCNTIGYFPHVGVKLWKRLKPAHTGAHPFKSSDKHTRTLLNWDIPMSTPKVIVSVKRKRLDAPIETSHHIDDEEMAVNFTSLELHQDRDVVSYPET